MYTFKKKKLMDFITGAEFSLFRYRFYLGDYQHSINCTVYMQVTNKKNHAFCDKNCMNYITKNTICIRYL